MPYLIMFWRLIWLNYHQICFISYDGHLACNITTLINIYVGFDEKGSIASLFGRIGGRPEEDCHYLCNVNSYY